MQTDRGRIDKAGRTERGMKNRTRREKLNEVGKNGTRWKEVDESGRTDAI